MNLYIINKKFVQKNGITNSQENLEIDPIMCYHILQTVAFGLMATIIMRLKLFFTPQLCILSALLQNKKVSVTNSLIQISTVFYITYA